MLVHVVFAFSWELLKEPEISIHEVKKTVHCQSTANDANGLDGTVVRRRAHDPRVVCSIPALATFEDNILGQGLNTNCASLHLGVLMGT